MPSVIQPGSLLLRSCRESLRVSPPEQEDEYSLIQICMYDYTGTVNASTSQSCIVTSKPRRESPLVPPKSKTKRQKCLVSQLGPTPTTTTIHHKLPRPYPSPLAATNSPLNESGRVVLAADTSPPLAALPAYLTSSWMAQHIKQLSQHRRIAASPHLTPACAPHREYGVRRHPKPEPPKTDGFANADANTPRDERARGWLGAEIARFAMGRTG
jgi:hypothetical protein